MLGALANRALHGHVDFLHGHFQCGRQRRCQFLKIQLVATPPGQPLAARHNHRSAGLQRKPRGQRHRVGITAEERRPDTQPLRRHLIGQQPDGLALAQRLDHLPHPRQRRRNRLRPRAIACRLQNLGQPGLTRRAVQHGDVSVLPRPALGRRMHRQLKAPQMRREKHNALASGIGALGHLAIDDGASWQRLAQPDARRLEHHAPRMADSGAHLPEAVTSLPGVVHKPPAVGGRERKRHPSHDSTHKVQQAYRQHGQ
ncbi:hypothetical protein SDC9_145582 [bioreactor metagenome]|uniref:Uncharacterized protein n=1 Tax=bioreactor metagenome TaxID=1076179 RepID=A0A645E9V2_9ZZZZ